MAEEGAVRPVCDGRGGWRRLVALLLVAMLVGLWAPAARALESATVRSPRDVVSIVTDTDAVAPGTPFRAGLRFRLSPGWHVYWQNPGDAGVAPDVSFTLPAGAHASGIDWPAPTLLREGPVVVYSYADTVLLPVTITPPATLTGPKLHLAAHADWLVCEKICVPEQGDFALDVPVGAPAASAEAPLFAATDRLIPRPSPFTARISPHGRLAVAGPGLSAKTVADAWFLPAAWGPIDQSAPEKFSADDGGIAIALKPGPGFKPGEALHGVLGVRDRGGEASYFSIVATPGVLAAAAAAPAGPGLARVIGLALLGGLILNLMPCVFPVLAMKAVALARAGTLGRRHARITALAYLAGVLAAFAALGAALLAARAAGSAAGWGFQFQSPVFVAVMALVLFGVGLNLSGVFGIGGGGIAGAGQSFAARGGWAGSFFTGLLAVVVATPCTAPFMGAAIAAALAAPVWAALAIFLAMGFGLALPYLALAEIPWLTRHLPRPGRWMDVLKQALAFPMYAATAWLVWVVSQQAGSAGLLPVLAALVFLGAAAWAAGLAATLGRRGRMVAQGFAVLALLAAGLALPGLAAVGTPGRQAAAQPAGEEPFTPERLAALRAAGRPVFVNLTADWCVSCLVNERVALEAADVRAAFAAHDIAYLKGDWTRQNPEIGAFLRAHGRDGVPLYLFYRPGAAAPVVLPQILTPRLVLNEVAGSG
jgi:thiol:disulfide interchange protein DsbD